MMIPDVSHLLGRALNSPAGRELSFPEQDTLIADCHAAVLSQRTRNRLEELIKSYGRSPRSGAELILAMRDDDER